MAKRKNNMLALCAVDGRGPMRVSLTDGSQVIIYDQSFCRKNPDCVTQVSREETASGPLKSYLSTGIVIEFQDSSPAKEVEASDDEGDSGDTNNKTE